MILCDASSRPGLTLLCLDPAHCRAGPDSRISGKRVQIWEGGTEIPVAQWSLKECTQVGYVQRGFGGKRELAVPDRKQAQRRSTSCLSILVILLDFL